MSGYTEETTGDLVDDEYIRCPACGHTMSVSKDDLSNLYEEGLHDVYCQHCDALFQTCTYVSFLFKSPAVDKK